MKQMLKEEVLNRDNDKMWQLVVEEVMGDGGSGADFEDVKCKVEIALRRTENIGDVRNGRALSKELVRFRRATREEVWDKLRVRELKDIKNIIGIMVQVEMGIGKTVVGELKDCWLSDEVKSFWQLTEGLIEFRSKVREELWNELRGQVSREFAMGIISGRLKRLIKK